MPNQYTILPQEDLPEGKKRCMACGEIKELTEFYVQGGRHKSGNKRTDRRTQCKKCISRKNAEYQKIRRQKEKEELHALRAEMTRRNVNWGEYGKA